MPNYMLDAQGRVVPRDDSVVEMWLALHGESRTGKAWCFSTNGERAQAIYMPKAMCTVGGPNGGFERWDHNCQRVLIPVVEVAMPAFMAMEKGLIAKPGARAM